jgi:hypothetical protein
LLELEVGSSLEVVVGFIEILLLDFYFGDLVESLACEVVVVVCTDYLLEVQD